ncbi:MAG: corrinoid protein [Deltaproteobacteria bacterium]|nr:corrinoid protein [Deltaproteobacteria bacterium]
MSDLFRELGQHLYDGDAPGVIELTRKAIEQGLDAREILNAGLLPGMERVGRDFKDGELFIPEVIVAARAMHAGIELLKPLLARGAGPASRKIALGTVKGDLHDIGKKLVGIMMQGAGFEVIDLGHDVPPERFVEVVSTLKPDLIGMSALLSTTMPMMKNTIEAIRAAGLSGKVKILVGGAPITQAWADEIGADGFAPDAVGAVECARRLL